MNKTIWLFALFLLPAFGLAAAPTVDFLAHSDINAVFTPIIFDPDVVCVDCNSFLWSWGDSDANANYYYSNTPDFNIIDDFESGSLAAWTIVAGSTSTIQGVVVKEDTKALKQAPGAGNDSIRRPMADMTDQNIRVWARTENALATATYLQLQDATPALTAVMKIENNDFWCSNGVGYQAFGVGAISDVWYRFLIEYNAGTGKVSCYAYDATDALIGAVINKNPWTGGGVPKNIVLASTNGTSYFDDPGNQTGTFGIPIDTDKNETHSYSSVGTFSPCLTAGNKDGNTTQCHDITISGNLLFYVFDENTRTLIQNPVARTSTATYYGSNGLISIPTPSNQQEYEFVVYDNNHQSRIFTFDLNAYSAERHDIFLLDQNRSRQYNFFVLDENGNSYPNKIFRIMRDGNLVWKGYTDNYSYVFSVPLMNQPVDYNFFVDDSVDGNNLFWYGDSNLIIKIPINELTLEIVSPFGIKIRQSQSLDINNLTTQQTIKTYPNTYDPYLLSIDANTLSYISRYYAIRTVPKTNYTLQPYLLRITDGSAIATMILSDSFSGQAIARYTLEFYTDVGNQANRLVESGYSDSAGELIFTTITGKPYDLILKKPDGTILKTGPFISSTETKYYFDVFTGIISIIVPQNGIVDLNVLVPSPSSRMFKINEFDNYGFRALLVNTGSSSITNVKIEIDQNNAILATQTFTPTFPSSSFPAGHQFDVNFVSTTTEYPVLVYVTLTTNAGIITRNFVFPINAIPSIYSPPDITFLRDEAGDFVGILIWIIIYFMISLALRFAPQFGLDNNGMIWVMAVWTGFATFIGLIPFFYGFLAIIGGIAMWGLQTRPLR